MAKTKVDGGAVCVFLCMILLAGAFFASCGPTPTRGDYTEQRKVNFFKVLTYEAFPTSGGGSVQVILFEDAVGNCYITSGVDGGIQNVPTSACEGAKKVPVEAVKPVK